MKTLKLEIESFKEKIVESEPKLVEHQTVIGGFRKLDKPTLSSDLKCLICDESKHSTFRMESKIDAPFVWFCLNPICACNTQKIPKIYENTQGNTKRAVSWPLFCELNGIGNVSYSLKFEDVQQSNGRIEYFRKFAEEPNSFILMHGDKGRGKTFASMAICELFTRNSTSAIFTTQKQMAENLEIARKETCSNYIQKLRTSNILVIDDFGTSEMTPTFLSFFMDLMNTRMQWTDRGTIITTNLDLKKFSEYCGEALIDRLNTGVQMEFKGQSLRKPKIL